MEWWKELGKFLFLTILVKSINDTLPSLNMLPFLRKMFGYILGFFALAFLLIAIMIKVPAKNLQGQIVALVLTLVLITVVQALKKHEQKKKEIV
jgi:hypothetical protein